VAAFQGFAPFAWREGSEARGRDIAFLKLFAESEQLELDVEFHDFDRLWELPERGAVDIAASGISLMPDKRCTPVAWSAPYSNVRRSLLIRGEEQDRFQGMEDLAFARLAVVAASAAHGHANETLPDTGTLTFCDTLEQGIDDLLSGQVDAVGTGDVSARHHISVREGLAMVDVHCARSPEYISFAVRPAGGLLDRLNAFIEAHAMRY
jgi:polar amino acid transport system substrate-binding protein